MVGGVKNKASEHPILVSEFRKNTSYSMVHSSNLIPLDVSSSLTPLWHVLYTLVVMCIFLKLDCFPVSKWLATLFFLSSTSFFWTGQVIIALQSLVLGCPPAGVAPPLPHLHSWTGVPVPPCSHEEGSWRSCHVSCLSQQLGSSHLLSLGLSAYRPVSTSSSWALLGWMNGWPVSATQLCM